MKSSVVIIPVYQEMLRFNFKQFLKEAKQNNHIDFLFIDDGSTDLFNVKMKEICSSNFLDNVKIVKLENNMGKGFALKKGITESIQMGYHFIGILDADFSAPISEISKLFAIIEQSKIDVICGSRKRTQENLIKTSYFRFASGRIFNLLVRFKLKITMYDTQCGCKVFRNTPLFEKLIADIKEPERWLFDLQILVRANSLKLEITEFPLDMWIHQSNSKLKFIQAAKDCANLAIKGLKP